VALAPDFSRGKTTASIEEAEALGAELDRNVKRWRGDIVGALQFLRQHGATRPTDGRGAFGFVAFSTSRLLRAGYIDQSGRGDRRRRDLLCHLSWPGLPRCESGLPVPRGFGGPLRVGGVSRGNATGTWCSRKADDLLYVSRNQALVLRCQSSGGLRCFRRCPSMGTNGRLASTPNCAARSGRFLGEMVLMWGVLLMLSPFCRGLARSQMTRLGPNLCRDVARRT
jgi:hypothetical protein